MSPLFGLILIAIILIVVVGFIAIVIAALYFFGQKKTAKYLLFFVVGIFVIYMMSFFFSMIKDSFFRESKLKETLSKSGIVIKEDFEILHEKENMDFEIYENDFSLKLSKKESGNLIQKSIKNENQTYILVDSIKAFYNEDKTYTNFDTLRIELKNNILKYHRANVGRETPKNH